MCEHNVCLVYAQTSQGTFSRSPILVCICLGAILDITEADTVNLLAIHKAWWMGLASCLRKALGVRGHPSTNSHESSEHFQVLGHLNLSRSVDHDYVKPWLKR